MAKRPQAYVPPQPANLTPEQMRQGITRLKKRIVEIQAFDPQAISDRSDPSIQVLEAAIKTTVADIFDPASQEYRTFSVAAVIDTARHNYAYQVPHGEIVAGLERGKQRAERLLWQAITYLEEKLPEKPPQGTRAEPSELSLNVFVVHGHDDAAREEVARFLSKAGLNPIILHEQPSGGMTVIEKLERYSDVGFAVVLLTPDDIGGPKGTDPANLQPRARQNVVAELFYFLGKLGRSQVCALRKGSIENPSDIGGVVYIDMAGGSWKTDLLRELETAGYRIDWREALR